MTLPSRIRKPKKPKDGGRVRSPKHRKWVRTRHCVVPGCMDVPVECAHVRLGTNGAMGVKPDDIRCISLCLAHHTESHSRGELSFAQRYGLNLLDLAGDFARGSPDPKIRQHPLVNG